MLALLSWFLSFPRFATSVCTEKMLNVQTVQGSFGGKLLNRSLTICSRSSWSTSFSSLCVLGLSNAEMLTVWWCVADWEGGKVTPALYIASDRTSIASHVLTGHNPNGCLLALPANIRLGWKWMAVANTPAYNSIETIMTVKVLKV